MPTMISTADGYTTGSPGFSGTAVATGLYVSGSATLSGPIRYNSEQWDDMYCPINQAIGGQAPLAFEQYGTSGMFFYTWHETQDEPLYAAWQMPHGWKRDSEVRPHMHVIPLLNPVSTQTVVITGAYAWQDLEGNLVTSGWTQFSSTYSVSATGAFTASVVSLFQSTPPSGTKESAILHAYWRRHGTGETYTGKLALVSIDAHVQKEKTGTPSYIPT